MSTQNRRSQLSHNASVVAPSGIAESKDQGQAILLSRSPHPYRRSSHGSRPDPDNGYLLSPAVTPLQSDFELSIRRETGRGLPEDSSDSGTDADDEAIQHSKKFPITTVIPIKGQRYQSAKDRSSTSGAGKGLIGGTQPTRTDRNVLRRFLELVSSLCICGVVLLGPEVAKSAYYIHRGASYQ